MHKDFDRWNKVKKEIEVSSENKSVLVGEFYWCKIGLNIGSEENGKYPIFNRPVFIFKKIDYYKCAICPLTTSGRKYINKIRLGYINRKKNYLILDQLKIIDTKRIEDRIEIINNNISIKATKAVLGFLDSFRNTQ